MATNNSIVGDSCYLDNPDDKLYQAGTALFPKKITTRYFLKIVSVVDSSKYNVKITGYKPMVKRGWLDGAWNFEAYETARNKEIGQVMAVPYHVLQF